MIILSGIMERASALAVMPDSPERRSLIRYFRDCSYSPITALSEVPDVKTIITPKVAVVDLGLPNSRTLVDFLKKNPNTFVFGIPSEQDSDVPGIGLLHDRVPLDYQVNLFLAVYAIINHPSY